MTRARRKIDSGVSHPKRILLADDDASVRGSLATLLVGEGYLVLTATNGEQALQIASGAEVDLVLLDLNMPVKDGWATLQAFSYKHPAIPVVLITAQPNQLLSAVAAGVSALLEKPMDIPHLLDTVRRLAYEPPKTRWARLNGNRAGVSRRPGKRDQP